jgi:hypothetical protein
MHRPVAEDLRKVKGGTVANVHVPGYVKGSYLHWTGALQFSSVVCINAVVATKAVRA